MRLLASVECMRDAIAGAFCGKPPPRRATRWPHEWMRGVVPLSICGARGDESHHATGAHREQRSWRAAHPSQAFDLRSLVCILFKKQ